MHLLPKMAVKKIRDIEPGELIEFKFRRSRAIGFVMGHEAQSTAVAVLYSYESDIPRYPPFAFGLSCNQNCLTYGQEWVLEVIASKHSYAGNQEHYQEPGVVYVNDEGPTIFLPWDSPLSHMSEGISFNFAKREIVNDASREVPYLNWKIWTSERHREEAPNNPIVDFKGVGTP